VSDVKPRFSLVVRMDFASGDAAHLAGESVSIQYEGPGFFGDAPFEGWSRFTAHEDVLPRAEVGTVVVGGDVHSFFVAKLTDPAAPLRGACHLS